MACCGDKWMFCCCCHVTKAAHIIAWMALILTILGGVLNFLYAPAFRMHSAMFILIALVTGLPIILGNLLGKRSHRIYWPFLIINGIYILHGFLQIIFLSMHTIFIFKSPAFVDVSID
uniref:Inner membrane protein n=1 Tax=Globodera pallida TaxID=36090 RepID=A0A183C1Q8_GLOPA